MKARFQWGKDGCAGLMKCPIEAQSVLNRESVVNYFLFDYLYCLFIVYMSFLDSLRSYEAGCCPIKSSGLLGSFETNNLARALRAHHPGVPSYRHTQSECRAAVWIVRDVDSAAVRRRDSLRQCQPDSHSVRFRRRERLK